ncbi:MAG: iron-containing redox enzyme family protein [Kofleriaceae bacterium]
MNRAEFREALLQLMEKKVHWAWPRFGDGTVPKEKLNVHFEQEYATYVRDFPVLVGWAYVQCPNAEVRRDLAENIYEEETGGKIAGKPHPELFLEYPRGLGMDLSRFTKITLAPAAAAFRATIDEYTQRHGWAAAAAVTTIFLEGTNKERGELDPHAPKREAPPLEDHPLVVHYGLPLDALALTKAHRKVEGSHRIAAWRCFDHVAPADYPTVLEAMEHMLAAWLAYRDEVAAAVGLAKGT